MNELNTNPILAAILAALNDHIDARIKAALEAQPKPETNVTVDMDALRELVTPLVGSMVEAKIEEAINAHCEDYDHDSYDSATATVEDHDFDDFVKNDDLENAVKDAVNNLTFEISVS